VEVERNIKTAVVTSNKINGLKRFIKLRKR
jgi:hypothetical protein